jgi:hypothetical protein
VLQNVLIFVTLASSTPKTLESRALREAFSVPLLVKTSAKGARTKG